MSPRGLVAAFSRFSRPARRQVRQARQRRSGRPATRAPHLAAELLESRCMLSATARLENNTSMFDRIPVIHGSQPANPGGSFVGQFFWNGSGFKSFCVEGQQSISPGLHTFPTVTSLSTSGLANADLVEQFWRSYGPTTTAGFTSVTDAAAFQLGIWELISDGVARDLKSGSFRVGDSASPAVALAESWLNGTGTPAAGAGGSVPLHVMQHPTMQDQVIWGPLPPPSVSVKVTPTSVTEDCRNKLTYELTASPAPTSAITVNYRIGGSAKAGSDFTGLPPGATTGTITIRAGSTSPVTLTIVPKADTEIEPNETVILTLQQGAGYALGTSVATGTITNDDLPEVTLAVAPASVTEDGTTNLVYTFTRTGPPTSRLEVNYGITGTADGADYSGATPGAGKKISFNPGFATATVTITPTPDTLIEPDETVVITLQSGTGYGLGTDRVATGTIENDDFLVDLDVDSNNDGKIDDDDDANEEKTELPGVIVLVGGGRAKMIASVPAGRTATLAVGQGANKVRVYGQETGGEPLPGPGQSSIKVAGGAPTPFWVEAGGQGATLANIGFTLTADVSSGRKTPPPSDTVLATSVTFTLLARGGGPSNPYLGGHEIKNLLAIWPGDPITIEATLMPSLPDPLPGNFIVWSTSTVAAPPANTRKATFTRAHTGMETVSVTLPLLGVTRRANINYPDVGTISETPGLALLDPALYATAAFYGFAAQAYADNLRRDGMSDDDANAIQHAYWNALIASDPAWTPADALLATTAHEYSNKADGGLAFDTVSDLHNNYIGAQIVLRNASGQILIGQQ
jgi:hypothetical protein